MIDSRRAPIDTGPSLYEPPLSGPRCTSARSMSSARPSVVPAIPHMGRSLFAATGGGGEGLCRGLAVHAAPDEARLPAGEPPLVGELEIEEGTHVRLAGGEGDRVAEVPRLQPGAQRRHVLAAVVAPPEPAWDRRLEAVLEVPDVRLSEGAQHGAEPRVVALAD